MKTIIGNVEVELSGLTLKIYEDGVITQEDVLRCTLSESTGSYESAVADVTHMAGIPDDE